MSRACDRHGVAWPRHLLRRDLYTVPLPPWRPRWSARLSWLDAIAVERGWYPSRTANRSDTLLQFDDLRCSHRLVRAHLAEPVRLP